MLQFHCALREGEENAVLEQGLRSQIKRMLVAIPKVVSAPTKSAVPGVPFAVKATVFEHLSKIENRACDELTCRP